MGIIKISEVIHDELRVASDAMDRSLNGQAEHWIKIGMLAELHQDLCYKDLVQLLIARKKPSFKIELKKRSHSYDKIKNKR